jgi:HK97 family phage portal protein
MTFKELLMGRFSKADTPKEKKGYFEDKDNARNDFLSALYRYFQGSTAMVEWSPVDRDSLMRQFESNHAVYSIVNYIADEVAKVMVEAAELEDKERTQIEQHWSIDLLRQPNDLETMTDFIRGWTIYRLVVGDAFVYTREGVGIKAGQISELYNIPSHLVKIVTRGLAAPIAGYVVKGTGGVKFNTNLTTDNVIFFRNFAVGYTDGTTPIHYGLSPLVPAAKLVELIDNSMKRQNTALKNGGVARIVTPRGTEFGVPTPQEQSALEAEMNDRHLGNRTKILKSPVDVHQLGDSPADLSLLSTSDSAIQALCFTFKFPYSLFQSNTTYANQAEAKRIVIENIAIPLASEFLEKFTKYCRFENGEKWIVNTDKIEALKANSMDVLNAYDRAYRSYNDRADLLGLSRIDEDWADQPIFPMSIMFGNPMTEIPEEGNGEEL